MFGATNWFFDLMMVLAVTFLMLFLAKWKSFVKWYFLIGLFCCLALALYSYFETIRLSRNVERRIQGKYSLDLKNTPLEDSVYLTFYPDNKFSLSREIPFLCGIEGRWKCRVYGEFNFCEIKLDNSRKIRLYKSGQRLTLKNPVDCNNNHLIRELDFQRALD